MSKKARLGNVMFFYKSDPRNDRAESLSQWMKQQLLVLDALFALLNKAAIYCVQTFP